MDDRGESGVLAEVILVGGVAALGVLLVLLLTAERADPPSALALAEDADVAGEVRSFTVTAAVAAPSWRDVAVLVDGRPLVYDDQLLSAGTYCIVEDGAVCSGSPDARVMAGHRLRMRDVDPPGSRLALVDADAELVLYARTLSG